MLLFDVGPVGKNVRTLAKSMDGKTVPEVLSFSVW